MGAKLSRIAEAIFKLLPRKVQNYARGRLVAGTIPKETATPCGTLSFGLMGWTTAFSCWCLALSHMIQRVSTMIHIASLHAGLQVPSTIHATLTPEELGHGQVIIIGDVHGCPVELQALLDKCVIASV